MQHLLYSLSICRLYFTRISIGFYPIRYIFDYYTASTNHTFFTNFSTLNNTRSCANPCSFTNMTSSTHMCAGSNMTIVIHYAIMINSSPCIYNTMLTYYSICINYHTSHYNCSFPYNSRWGDNCRGMNCDTKFTTKFLYNHLANTIVPDSHDDTPLSVI